MAEQASDGCIVISKAEEKTPILVSTLNRLQVPIAPASHTTSWRLWVSMHGDVTKTWHEYTPDTVFDMPVPFYIMSKYQCIVAGMEV